MLRLTLLAVSVILSAFPLRADEAPANTSRLEAPSTFNDSSESNRENKFLNINIEPLGIGPTGYFSHGISVGYFLNKDSILQLEYTQDSYDLTNPTTNRKEDVERRNSLGFSFKQFVSNSFYYKAGFNQQHYTVQSIRFDGWKNVLSAGIGNQWQWENLTVGCDWIGFDFPVSTSTAKANQSIAYDSNVELLRLYLGASF